MVRSIEIIASTWPGARCGYVHRELQARIPAIPTKPRVRRYIVESDLTRVGDRPHCKDTVVIDCHEHRIARLDNPRPDDLRGLIGEPSPQDLRVIPVIGLAQFRNRSPYHLARSKSIFANCIADFYDARRIVFWRLTPFFGYQSHAPYVRSLAPR